MLLLERQSHSKMESEVAAKLRVNNRVVSSSRRVGRVYSFHTSIETQNEIIEVEAQS